MAERRSLKPFEYRRPSPDRLAGRAKTSERLASYGNLHATVQVVDEGGENNLHSHPGTAGFWYVLGGQARFHDADGEVGVYGVNEGVLIPSGVKYWFEKSGDGLLEILHIAVTEPGVDVREDRINHAPLAAATRLAYEAYETASPSDVDR